MWRYTFVTSREEKDTQPNYEAIGLRDFHSIPIPNPNSSNLTSSYPLINIVLDNTTTTGSKKWVFHWELIDKPQETSVKKSHNFPLFFAQSNIIRIPKKTKYAVMNLLPKKKLKEIHPNILVAQELCLLFLSQLSSTYYTYSNRDDLNGWKSLYSPYLRSLLHVDKKAYILIREVLETRLEKGPIIECDYKDIPGKKSYNYRLGPSYLGKGIDSYVLQTEVCQNLYKKKTERLYSKGDSNVIYQNLMEFYSTITLPTVEEIQYHAKELTKSGYRTKKGKRLTFLNKHAKSSLKDQDKMTFVEDGIDIYKSLTEGGLIVPHIGDKRSGGRVTDSINLMPGWIRQLIKVNGQTLVECDFSCFHPNIAMILYDGTTQYLTHNDVAERAKIDLTTVKLEHLSFFNKHPKEMESSPLFNYYHDNECELIKRIIDEKYNSEFKHKKTSMRMFQKEVEIMTEAIRILNQKGIFVGYIYDAILCQPNQLTAVKEAMNEASARYGVKTTAK
jgi:hypothetical protein